ncbi:MAG: MBL fold metallo-hydrolase [Candidatus Lokiarchaeota archaeon]|nr:MBL fold metallo-hydrolase [Candidatus Lokiarchaeota archaeon]
MISQDKILKDGKLHIFLLGSGGPLNNNTRVTSSIAVIGNGEFILFDVGPGTFRNADVMRLPIANLSAIFLTHFHSDHIGDLGEANMLSWVNGRNKPLEVYGPMGIEKVVNGFIMAYELDTEYRIAHHGSDILQPEFSKLMSKPILIENYNDRKLCFDRNELKIYAFEVDHSPVKPAFGYRIEYKGNVVVITGDTIKTENLVKHSQNTDLLFCEAISYEMLNNIITGANKLKLTRYVRILTDIKNYHMEPITAAKLAKEAKAKKLVIIHITPPLTNEFAEKMYLKGVDGIFDGEVILGSDCMKFKLDPKKELS